MDTRIWSIMALFLILLLLATYFIAQAKKNGLRATVVGLIVYAEDNFLKGANREKMEYVVERILALLPIPMRFFVTYEFIEKFVQNIFDDIKEALDYKGGQG